MPTNSTRTILCLIIKFKNLRERFNFYLNDQDNLNIVINSLEKFLATNYVTCFRDLEEYHSRTRKRSRYYVVLIIKAVIVLHCIRWFTTTLIRNDQANLILFNFAHMLGDPLLVTVGISALSLSILGIGLVTTYQEVTWKLFQGDIFYMIKKGSIQQNKKICANGWLK